jgi:hypothetical protein
VLGNFWGWREPAYAFGKQAIAILFNPQRDYKTFLKATMHKMKDN